MKFLICFIISFLSIDGLFSQEISGTWQGALNVQGTKLDIVFHIEKQENGYKSLMDSPTQGAFGIPTTKTTFDNNNVEIILSNLGIFYQGKLVNNSISGTFNQNGIPFPLVLKRTESKRPSRIQEPKEPYPYDVEEIKFKNNLQKIELAATLTLPKQKRKSPAVILIAGSGPNDRDETIFNHKPFWILADHLTRNGIAVLRYDKRGIGESEGEYFTATTQDFAEDVEAAIEYLKTRKEIDASQIGLIGHSEGGVIAPMVASDNKDISFVVLMAGLGITGSELSLSQNQFAFDKTLLSDSDKEELAQNIKNIYASVLTWEEYVGTEAERDELKQKLSELWKLLPSEITSIVSKESFIAKTTANIATPWFRSFLKIDPQQYLQKLTIPILAVNGENDTQVDSQRNLEVIEEALKKGNNKSYTIKSYPELNHLFQESVTGEIDEYGKIEQTISPKVLSDITSWIISTVKK
ncbi:MAG: alpha/beta fold hydrolase [Dysgonamonadaceae bacterium]|nr:alpha/beta fold hydrolase [Dysgonamonadaceae bacterium]